MTKYVVTYEETLARTLIVEAEDRYEAMEKMMDAVDRGEIELTPEDYVYDSGHVSDASLASAGDQYYYDFLG